MKVKCIKISAKRKFSTALDGSRIIVNQKIGDVEVGREYEVLAVFMQESLIVYVIFLEELHSFGFKSGDFFEITSKKISKDWTLNYEFIYDGTINYLLGPIKFVSNLDNYLKLSEGVKSVEKIMFDYMERDIL